MTWNKFNIRNQQMLGTAVQNLVTWVSWHQGFVHTCCGIWCPPFWNWHFRRILCLHIAGIFLLDRIVFWPSILVWMHIVSFQLDAWSVWLLDLSLHTQGLSFLNMDMFQASTKWVMFIMWYWMRLTHCWMIVSMRNYVIFWENFK